VMLIEFVALDIHLAGIPVAELGHALRRPMSPDAELGVAEPVRRLVLRLQRLPVSLEGPRCHGLGESGRGAGRRQRRSLHQQVAFGQHQRLASKDRFFEKKGSTKSWKRKATLLTWVPG